MKSYYDDNQTSLYNGDSLKILKNIDEESVDLIFSDPPYFLSSDGITCKNGKMVSVNKADWDKIDTYKEIEIFNSLWLKECQRILKPNGTIWVSGTHHNIFSVGSQMKQLNYKILNIVTWNKPNPPPNLSCRYFTHSTEQIIWAGKNVKTKHTYNYDLMKKINDNKQMKDVWLFTSPAKNEKRYGKHPTQKPEKLLERIILSSSKEGDLILDPFNGSGTTGVVVKRHNRRYIGIDLNKTFLDITIKRLKDEINL
jgi:site-specific DNA-methyltransferase (adenine-specific)